MWCRDNIVEVTSCIISFVVFDAQFQHIFVVLFQQQPFPRDDFYDA